MLKAVSTSGSGGGGGGGTSIGGAVTGGLDGSILFVHPAAILAQENPGFIHNTWDATNRYGLKVGPVSGATNNWNIWSGDTNINFSDPYDYGLAPNVFNVNNAWMYGDGNGSVVTFLSNVTTSGLLATGTHAVATSTGVNPILYLFGNIAESYHQSSGLLDNQILFDGYAENTGPVTNTIVFHAQNPSTSSTITNAYGLKIDPQTTGTNNWNIWSGPTAGSFSDPAGFLGLKNANVFAYNDTTSGDGGAALIYLETSNISGISTGLEFGAFAKHTSGTKGILSGIFNQVGNIAAGTTTDLVGFESYGTITAGTVTNATGFYVDTFIKSGSGAVTNGYGLYVQDVTVGSTINQAIHTGSGNILLGDLAGTGTRYVTASSTGQLSTSTLQGALTWSAVTANQSLVVNAGVLANKGTLLTLTLPTTAAVGDVIEIGGEGAGGWLIAQNASGQINFGSSATTVGITGSLASTNAFDCVKLVCRTANNVWLATSAIGNLTVV